MHSDLCIKHLPNRLGCFRAWTCRTTMSASGSFKRKLSSLKALVSCNNSSHSNKICLAACLCNNRLNLSLQGHLITLVLALKARLQTCSEACKWAGNHHSSNSNKFLPQFSQCSSNNSHSPTNQRRILCGMIQHLVCLTFLRQVSLKVNQQQRLRNKSFNHLIFFIQLRMREMISGATRHLTWIKVDSSHHLTPAVCLTTNNRWCKCNRWILTNTNKWWCSSSNRECKWCSSKTSGTLNTTNNTPIICTITQILSWWTRTKINKINSVNFNE